MVGVQVLTRGLVHEFHGQAHLDLSRVSVPANFGHLDVDFGIFGMKVFHRHHLGVVAVVPLERELVADVGAVHQAVAAEPRHADEDAEGPDVGDAALLDGMQRRWLGIAASVGVALPVPAALGRRWRVGFDVREPALVPPIALPPLKGEAYPWCAPRRSPAVPLVTTAFPVPSGWGRRRWDVPDAPRGTRPGSWAAA